MIINITKENILKWTFREKNIIWKYDIQDDKITEKFEWKIDIEWMNWNIWVIVWPSWTWKSTIAKELFWNNFIELKYWNWSIIDEIWKDKTVWEITNIFNKVWFNTPKSWLKPYSVLSNGEKMRVDLANALLSDKEIIIFDEFTSVVDRQVASVASYAISKLIKKENKKFIAVWCHYDILDWIEPDWVFDTKDFTFTKERVATKDLQSNWKSENESIVNGNYLKNIII